VRDYGQVYPIAGHPRRIEAALARIELGIELDSNKWGDYFMSGQIQPGDVVVLKSGGPDMTVKWVSGNECYCEWFDGKKVIGNNFDVTSIRHAEKKVFI
jgi:uncharacterized protein YodC (DUF2158 family)